MHFVARVVLLAGPPHRPRLRLAGDLMVVATAIGVDLLVWGGDRRTRFGGTVTPWTVPVATVSVLAVLLLRWHRPVTVFWFEWVFGFAGLLLPAYEPFAGLLVALHAIACRARTAVALPALLASLLPFSIDSYDSAVATPGDPLPRSAAAVVLWAVLATAVWGLGRLTYSASRRADIFHRIQSAEAAQALQEQRLRLARELHDIVANSVSAMILQAAGAQKVVQLDGPIQQALQAIEATGVQAMHELHRLLGLLRSTGQADPPDQPGIDHIAALVDRARDNGLHVECVTQGARVSLGATIELVAYRVVQEALANTAKHAGRGAAAVVEMHWQREGLVLIIRDTAGAEPPDFSRVSAISSGQGLIGLRERVLLAGGRLDAHAIPGGGFLVRVSLPAAGRNPRDTARKLELATSVLNNPVR